MEEASGGAIVSHQWVRRRRRVRGALRHDAGRGWASLSGHARVATDITRCMHQIGGHVECLEIDDLRVGWTASRTSRLTPVSALARVGVRHRRVGREEDLPWGAPGVGRPGPGWCTQDIRADRMAYYHTLVMEARRMRGWPTGIDPRWNRFLTV